MSNSNVSAMNAAGVKRVFTRIAWDLLGANKEGWHEVVEQPIQNVAQPKFKKPGTGEVAQPIENKIKTGNTGNNEPGSKDAAKTDGPVIATEDERSQFFAAAKGLNAGPIKDYFDGATPRVEYAKNSQKPELITKLGEALNYNIVELQKLFSL